MADDFDMVDRGSRYGTKQINTPYKEIAPDVHAEVFALAGGTSVGPQFAVVVHNVATNGELFAVDCTTDYDYDSSGVNITALTRTTPDGVSYRQIWTRNEMGQLQVKSGWVRL
jgi:hypothetical protein